MVYHFFGHFLRGRFSTRKWEAENVAPGAMVNIGPTPAPLIVRGGGAYKHQRCLDLRFEEAKDEGRSAQDLTRRRVRRIFRIGFIVCSSKFAARLLKSVRTQCVRKVFLCSAQFHCVFKQVRGPPLEISANTVCSQGVFVFRTVSLCV